MGVTGMESHSHPSVQQEWGGGRDTPFTEHQGAQGNRIKGVTLMPNPTCGNGVMVSSYPHCAWPTHTRMLQPQLLP